MLTVGVLSFVAAVCVLGMSTTASGDLYVWDVHDDWDPNDGVPDPPPPSAWSYQESTGLGQYTDLPNWGNISFGDKAWGVTGSDTYPLVGPRVGDFDYNDDWSPDVDPYIAANGIDLLKVVHMPRCFTQVVSGYLTVTTGEQEIAIAVTGHRPVYLTSRPFATLQKRWMCQAQRCV